MDELIESLADIVADRAEGLLTDDGVDYDVCEQIVRSILAEYVVNVDCNACLVEFGHG
jgi:hypothetical protein